MNTWADRVEEFSSNVNENNAFSSDYGLRFFIIKRTEYDFTKVSLFFNTKSYWIYCWRAKIYQKLRSGKLFIELKTNLQASKFQKCTSLANIPITVTTHRTLNSCRGVISESDLQYVSEEELLENLKNQKVIHVQRIFIFKNSEKIATKHIIFTFASTKLPRSLKAGYLKCPIRPYIANPLSCFKCQRFGHYKTSCHGKTTCVCCVMVGHENLDCQAPVRCVNCKQEHPWEKLHFILNAGLWEIQSEMFRLSFFINTAAFTNLKI